MARQYRTVAVMQSDRPFERQAATGRDPRLVDIGCQTPFIDLSRQAQLSILASFSPPFDRPTVASAPAQ